MANRSESGCAVHPDPVRTPGRSLRWACAGGLLAVLLLIPAGPTAGRSTKPLPGIVFVSRLAPTGEEAGQVPGLGPHGTFAGSGGRLLERAPDGFVRELLPAGRLHDVADPAISEDGTTIAFAGRERSDSPWRIWTVARSGGSPRCRTCADSFEADQEADPAWWGDALLYVSTRGGARSLYDGVAVTQLWILDPEGRRRQLTHEPHGVLDPVADRAHGRVLFSRWWFNPFHTEPPGVAVRTPPSAADSVNLWQVVSVKLVTRGPGPIHLEDMRLAAGGTLPRRTGMGLQPALFPDGALLAVSASNTGLAPHPGALAILGFGDPPGPGTRVAGAAIGDEPGDAYRDGANLAAPAACAPAALPDGRVLIALDPGGRGDFGLCLVSADGETNEMLVNEPGRWELDAAPDPPRKTNPIARRRSRSAGPFTIPNTRSLDAMPTFRYQAVDVYAGQGAPARRDLAILQVFELISDGSVRTLTKVPVQRDGYVDLRLPADKSLFEVLTDASGRALVGRYGVAQVRGFNSGAPGTTARCSGCHLGHSAAKK